MATAGGPAASPAHGRGTLNRAMIGSTAHEALSGPQPHHEPAVLVLADGIVLRGEAFGARGVALGEVVFNTGMTGYQEVITDPSYSGQLVTFTYPELGNTGVNAQDQEASHPHARGVIARQLSPTPSSWRSDEALERWLQRHGIVGIRGVDTRALVRHLREGGGPSTAASPATAPNRVPFSSRSGPHPQWTASTWPPASAPGSPTGGAASAPPNSTPDGRPSPRAPIG